MIRLARLEDALAIHNLHTRSVRQLCSADYPNEVIDGWLQNRSPEGYRGIAKGEMYVFEENGVVVGFSHVKPGVIIALFVDPAHVRKGIGRALFDHALPIARSGDRSHTALPIEVTLTALPFYLKCGCKEVSRSFVQKNAVKVETVRMLLPETAERTLQSTPPEQPGNVDTQKASRTALGTAWLRAAHQLLDATPRILDDPVAVRLLGEDAGQKIRESAERYRTPETAGLRSHVVLRSRFAEDRLGEAVRRGVSQYVILGAGFDTFAFRQLDWAKSLKITEIDHPDTQSLKRSFLAKAKLDLPANVHFGQIDFERESLLEGLGRHHVSLEEPTFFSWLGVTVYLKETAVDAALKSMAAYPSGSEVVLTFKQPPGKTAGRAAEAVRKLAEHVASVGEPFVSFFQPPAMEAKLLSAGFSKVEFLDLKTADTRYFASRPADLPKPRQINIVSAIR